MNHPLAGLVLLFKTSGPVGNAARVHAATCPMVNTASRGIVKLSPSSGDELQAEVDDLNERGFPVAFCKCCKAAS